MKWMPTDAQSGDMVRIRIGTLLHYGVFVSEDEVIQFGWPPVPEYADRNEDIAVCAVDIDAFSCGRIVEVAVLDRKERKTRIPPEQTVKTARARIGTGGYNMIHNNCEHFAYECVFGEKKSEQTEYIRNFWKKKFGQANTR